MRERSVRLGHCYLRIRRQSRPRLRAVVERPICRQKENVISLVFFERYLEVEKEGKGSSVVGLE